MSKKSLLGALCFMLVCGTGVSASAQESGAAPKLLYPVDTRALGMGMANTAVNDNPFGIFSNAAANMFNEKAIGIGYSFNPDKTEENNGISTATHALGAYYNLNKNNGLALGFRYYSLEETMLSDGTKVKPADMAISLAYSRRIIDNLSLSLTARYISSDYSAVAGMKNGSAFAFDLGVYYRNCFRNFNGSTWALGLNVSNVGTKLDISTPATMPAYAKLGGSADMIFSENHKLLAALDLGYTFMPSADASFTAGLGLEYNFYKYGMIRAGYRYGDNLSIPTGSYITLGAGVNINDMVRVDFAYLLADKKSPVKDNWTVGVGVFF